ncbi:MAG: AI-2E family transporter, partial [Maritimibacter sp.]|nr:AI-2E family transporter [Maritimibacter sp.]
LSLIGLPAAPLWGVVAALANFVLYLGPAVVAAALLVAGTVVFDGAESFLPAAVFVGLNAMEGQFVTPTLL